MYFVTYLTKWGKLQPPYIFYDKGSMNDALFGMYVEFFVPSNHINQSKLHQFPCDVTMTSYT